ELERVRGLVEPGVRAGPRGEPAVLRTIEQDHHFGRVRWHGALQVFGDGEGARAGRDLVGDHDVGTPSPGYGDRLDAVLCLHDLDRGAAPRPVDAARREPHRLADGGVGGDEEHLHGKPFYRRLKAGSADVDDRGCRAAYAGEGL